MRLDDWFVLISAAVCCFISIFNYGLVFQSVAIIVLIVFVVKSMNKRQQQLLLSSSNTNKFNNRASSISSSTSLPPTPTLSSSFVPPFHFGASGLIFPILLACEKIYHLTHSIGYNTIPLYASLIWLWVSLTEEERRSNGSSNNGSASPQLHFFFNGLIVVDRNRFELTMLYGICMGILFSLLTMNVHIGLGCSFFVIGAYVTETLLRTLFHEHRLSLRSGNAITTAVDDIRVIDSEIHLVSTFVGWVLCDFASNPFQENSAVVASSSSSSSSSSRRTVVTASPEMIVGRAMIIAAWIGIILFALLNSLNKMKNNVISTSSTTSTNRSSKQQIIFLFFSTIAFVGVFSLLLTGWTCADCFPSDNQQVPIKKPLHEHKPPQQKQNQQQQNGEDFIRENNEFNQEEMRNMRNVTLQQRIHRTILSMKQFAETSTKFTNPLWIWYKLIFDHTSSSSSSSASASSPSASGEGGRGLSFLLQTLLSNGMSSSPQINILKMLPLRVIWILLWIATLPFLSAFPFIAKIIFPSFHKQVPRIVWRKWFHFVAVVSFLITSMTDGSFMALAWCGALALSALVEVGRICEIPPFSSLTPLLESVTDDRDAIVLRTHWYLMLGCALPVLFFHRCVYFWADNPHWLIYAACRILPGLGCLGVGDALSAVCGTLYGKHVSKKWAAWFPGGVENQIVRKNPVLTKKSRVGTVFGGFFLTLIISAFCMYCARFVADKMAGLPFTLENKFWIYGDLWTTVVFWLKAAAVLGFGSAFETVSGGVDNLEVPLLSLAVTFLLF